MSSELEILKSEIVNGAIIKASHMDTLIDHNISYSGTKQMMVLFNMTANTSSIYIPSNQNGSAYTVLKNDFGPDAYFGGRQLMGGYDPLNGEIGVENGGIILYASGSKFKPAKMLLKIKPVSLLGGSYQMNTSSLNWLPAIAIDYLAFAQASDYEAFGDKDGYCGIFDLIELDQAQYTFDGTYEYDMLPIVIYPNIASTAIGQSITLQEYASYKLLTIEELY